jgi:hypothetical protein
MRPTQAQRLHQPVSATRRDPHHRQVGSPGPQRGLYLQPDVKRGGVHGWGFPQANRLTIPTLAAVAEHEAKAISLRQIATGLNPKGIGTVRGGAWSAVKVQRIMQRA